MIDSDVDDDADGKNQMVGNHEITSMTTIKNYFQKTKNHKQTNRMNSNIRNQQFEHILSTQKRSKKKRTNKKFWKK